MFPDSSCLFRQDERFIVPCIELRFVEIMSRLADEQTEPLCNGDVRGMEIVAQVSSVWWHIVQIDVNFEILWKAEWKYNLTYLFNIQWISMKIYTLKNQKIQHEKCKRNDQLIIQTIVIEARMNRLSKFINEILYDGNILKSRCETSSRRAWRNTL